MLADRTVLDVADVSKTFGGQKALDDVGLQVHSGKVHAVLGHNGSGKSTLIKILAGVYTPDSYQAKVLVDGHELAFGRPQASEAVGLRFVHQTLGLIPGLSVLENLRLGVGTYTAGRRGGVAPIRWPAERRAAREELEAFGMRVTPDDAFDDLSPVDRTQLAIVRALRKPESARVLVLDEPTATMPESQVEHLFTIIEQVRSKGISILYVSHRLEEILAIAQDVTVLRDGRVVATGPIEEFDKPRLVASIAGEAPGKRETAGPTTPADSSAAPSLVLQGVGAGTLKSLDLEVRPGEIVAVAGLLGSGVESLAPALSGDLPLEQGSVLLGGRRLERLEPRTLLGQGLAVLRSERDKRFVVGMTVRENVTLASLRRFTRRGRLRLAAERSRTRVLLQRGNVRPEGAAERDIAVLSGGNAQKVALLRLLEARPTVLVVDEPTQGIDVGGRAEVLTMLREACSQGLSVVICSSDLDDLAEVAGRVVVLVKGTVSAELRGADITRESILAATYGHALGTP